MSNAGVDTYLKERPNYFIETSVGKVYFHSGNLKELSVTSIDLEVYPYEGWDFKQFYIKQDMFDKLEQLYDFDGITTQATEDGWFLMIKLSDSYYGTPEYKIQVMI